MNEVFRALGKAFRSLLHPKMLVLTIWPMLGALVLWLGLAWVYWDAWAQSLAAMISGSHISIWLEQHGLSGIAHYSVLALLPLLIAPMILITAVLIAALVEMPIIVGFVAARDYAALDRRRGGTVPGSMGNALVAVLVFAVLWIVTLPLWFTGVLAPVVPVVLSAYLNQRLFRYDALSEHASADEYHAIVTASGRRMYMLGALLAMLYWVPFLNLMVPVLSGLAFAHFGLARLSELRTGKSEKKETRV
jgi:CysZ protein